MGRETISDIDFLKVDYDPRHFLYFNWRGYVSVEQVKAGCELMAAAAAQKNCYNWLNDNRLVRGTWTQSVRWIAMEFLPSIVRDHQLKIAFIYSPQLSARYSVDRLLEINDEYNAQTFDDYETAERWLLNELMEKENQEANTTEPSFGIRSNDRHYILRLAEISYIAADGKSAHIHNGSELHQTKISLEDIERRFADTPLMRVHRSYIINTDKISHISYRAGGSYTVFLKDHPRISIPVSRKHAPALKRRLGLLDDKI